MYKKSVFKQGKLKLMGAEKNGVLYEFEASLHM